MVKISVLKADTAPIAKELADLNYLLRRFMLHMGINIDEVPFDFEEVNATERVSYTDPEDKQIIDEHLRRMGK